MHYMFIITKSVTKLEHSGGTEILDIKIGGGQYIYNFLSYLT